jgi:hypothetical protein
MTERGERNWALMACSPFISLPSASCNLFFPFSWEMKLFFSCTARFGLLFFFLTDIYVVVCFILSFVACC